MKRKNILGLILSSSFLLGTVAFANDSKCGANMKCGAGKCGSSMQKAPQKMEPMQKDEMLVDDFDTKASHEEKYDQKKSVPQMKCGAGKCGSSMGN